jgi:hypothetical protein
MTMDTSKIEEAMEAARLEALTEPQRVPPAPVDGDPDQTVEVQTYEAGGVPGFRVVGRIRVGGYMAVRVMNHGPDTRSEREWPGDIEAAAAAYLSRCIVAGERHVERQGYTAARLVTCFDLLLRAKEAGVLEQRPKLVAVYGWLQGVKAVAASGRAVFPPAPHKFEQLLAENLT